MSRDSEEGCFVFAGIVIVLLLVLAWWVVSSTFEAAAYQSLTGKEVSTWQAMWLDLRVQESIK